MVLFGRLFGLHGRRGKSPGPMTLRVLKLLLERLLLELVLAHPLQYVLHRLAAYVADFWDWDSFDGFSY